VSWSTRFDVPIVLPSGMKLVTLDDARRHLLSLPKSKHGSPAVQAAIEALMMAANGEGPLMHANAGIARVVYGPKPMPEPRPATTRWGRKKLARDQ
jgi:hypothetical protein